MTAAAAAAMSDIDVEAADCRAALLPVSGATIDVTAVHGGPPVGGKLGASATIVLGGNSPPAARRAPPPSLNRRGTIQQAVAGTAAGASTAATRGRGTSTSSGSASASATTWKLKYQDFLPSTGGSGKHSSLSNEAAAAGCREQSESFQ